MEHESIIVTGKQASKKNPRTGDDRTSAYLPKSLIVDHLQPPN